MPKWHITSAQKEGVRGWNFQDRIAVWDLKDSVRAAAVFDGHGEVDDVVDHCFVRIKSLLTEATPETADECLKEALATLAHEVRAKGGGSTCSIALLFPNGFVATAVIGDSPIVSWRDAQNLFVSEEHNVRSNQKEAEAAIARGGIIKDGYLYAKHHNGGIQLTRALGDSVVSMVLSTEPALASFTVAPRHSVFLATDGLIDLSSGKGEFQISRLIEWIHKGVEPREILNRSHAYWEDGDDMSLIICAFH
jgi:serine/threonine protein phosphatase PrpC